MAAAVPESVNPFQAPPDVDSGDWRPPYSVELAEAEAVRKTHINHEASVKSIGSLYYLSAGIFLFLAVSSLAALGFVRRAPDVRIVPGLAIVIAIYLGLGLVTGVCGFGLRRLRGWVRIPVAILALLGLLGSIFNAFMVHQAQAMLQRPGSTVFVFIHGFIAIIHVYILYLLFCPKGWTVFSREYQDVIALTPHIKYRTSLIAWLALLLLILAIVGCIVAAAMR